MTILVTTPNGAVGRYLTEALRDRSDVRFFVRSEASAKALGKVRGDVFRGDATDVADVRNAVADVDRLYLAHPSAEDQIAAETALGVAAIEAGARRIVKLGARGFTGDGTVPDAVTGARGYADVRDIAAVAVAELLAGRARGPRNYAAGHRRSAWPVRELSPRGRGRSR
jgi:nucleoside-diphosphate-sugar epimerase